MDLIKILIVEDELIIAEDIKMQLIQIGYSVTGIASSYSDAIDLLNTVTPDLVILDIMIKGPKSGIDLGKHLRNEANIPFIYLSSLSDKKTVELAKETHPDAFLVKPFRAEGLFTSIEVSLSNAALKPKETAAEISLDNLLIKDCLFIKKGSLFYKIKIKDILFIKAEGNYLELYLNNDKKQLIRSSIKYFVQYLHDFTFFQCHKSYIINFEYIDIVSYTFLKIKEHEIPLSRSKKDELLSVMNSFS